MAFSALLRAGLAGLALAILALLASGEQQGSMDSSPGPRPAAAQGPCWVYLGGEFPTECTPTPRPRRRVRPVPVEATETTPVPQIQFPPQVAVLAPSPTATPTPTPTPTATPTPIPPFQFPPRVAVVAPTPTATPTGDLQPVRIEVLQSVSARFGTNDPEIPLVADKETLVRVYVQLTGDHQPRQAKVSLKALRPHLWGTEDLGICSPSFDNPAPHTVNPGLLTPTTMLFFRDDLSRTFNFHIDCPSWLEAGYVTFRASVQGAQCCTNNDTIEKTVRFHRVRPLTVRPWMMLYNGPGPHQGKVPTLGTSYYKAIYHLRAVYPAPVDWKPHQYIATPSGINLNADISNQAWWEQSGLAWWIEQGGQLLDWFHDCCMDWVDTNLGLLHPDIVGGLGIGYQPGFHALSGAGSGGTFAHEIGHNVGLPHASDAHGECAGGGCTPDWPYLHGGIEGHGWNAERPNKLILPTGTEGGAWHSHDLMSYGWCAGTAPAYSGSAPWYCENWLSPTHYGHIAAKLRGCTPAGSPACNWEPDDPFYHLWIYGREGQPTAADHHQAEVGIASLSIGLPTQSERLTAQATQEGEYLWVAGRISDETQAALRPFYRVLMPVGASDHIGQGSYRIDLVDPDGNNLVSRNFEPSRLAAHAPISRAVFNEAVRWHPATSRIVLRRGAAVLAERQVTDSTPTVTLLSPNGGEGWPAQGQETISWTAADADGDALFFWLEYSSDGGTTWNMIERNVQGTSYSVDLRNLAGSAQAMVRVLATDGVNTAMDASDGVFIVARKAPLVSIIELDEDQRVQAGEPLTLRVAAIDREDGMLRGASLTWESDLDGVLGTGETLVVRLSAGEHVITLTATDSDGLEGTDTLHLTVR